MDKRKNLFDLLLIFAEQKRLIIGVTLLAAVAAVIYSLLAPQIWTSRATLKPDAQTSSWIPINIPGLGGIMSSLMNNTDQEAQNALIILRSRSINEEVIRKFNLMSYFKIKDTDTLRAMDRALMKHRNQILGIGFNDENGLISISVSTKDKQLSQNIASYYVSRLDLYNRKLKVTKGKLNRQFLQSRVASARREIDSLAVVMKNFQKQNKTIDITTQMTSLVTMYSDVVAQKMITDLELELVQKNFNPEAPLVKELTHKRQIIAARIVELEKSSDRIKPSYLIDIDDIPDLTMQYTQLMINLEVQKKIFEYLYPQYEAAKIEELRDMPSIEVIDYPRMAGLRSHPKRAKICILSTLAGFILSLGIAYLRHQARQNKDKIKQIKGALFSKDN